MISLKPDQLAQYFQRIGGVSVAAPSEALLRDLVWKHAITIPFEALGAHIGQPTRIHNINQIFDKLVTQKRGGWCYEMNGLFFYVLKSLGFDAAFQLAAVHENDWLIPPTHAFLIVQLDGKKFLVDVGFGLIGLVEPIELKPSNTTHVMKNGIHYQLTQSPSGETIYSAGFNNKMMPQYKFTLSEKTLLLNDFLELNEFFSCSRESVFVQNVVVKMPTPNGFRKLINHDYTEYQQAGSGMQASQMPLITSKQVYLQLLKEKFGIQLASDVQFVSPLKDGEPVLKFETGSCS